MKFYTSRINKECAKSGNWRRAEELMVEMRLKGISPNVCTYNVLLKTYNNAGVKGEVLEHVLHRMVEEDGLVPDIISYHTG